MTALTDTEWTDVLVTLPGDLCGVEGWELSLVRRAIDRILGDRATTPDLSTGAGRRDEGQARAAARWTAEESAAVDQAIRDVASGCREAVTVQGIDLDYAIAEEWVELEFTTADVWAQLGPGFRVTKGIGGRMIRAANAGVCQSTRRTIVCPDTSAGPAKVQRLTVWRALP